MKNMLKKGFAVDRPIAFTQIPPGLPAICEAPLNSFTVLDGFLDERSFQGMIVFERMRSERSHKCYAVLLVATGESLPAQEREKQLEKISTRLTTLTQDTDLMGWYKANAVVGVIFTDILVNEKDSVVPGILAGVTEALRRDLTEEEFSQTRISINSYPEDWQFELEQRPSNPILYPDLESRAQSRRVEIVVKRVMDIVGSIIALVVLAPVMLLIAIAIKLTSPGPVLFKQKRIGQYGKPFVVFKFRSMRTDNDPSVHRQWFQSFYSGKAKPHSTNGTGGSYKLPNDPRVTRLGRWLRRSSLDEVPQFVNVLWGDMSLVGPRPPIPYEVDAYQAWHRGRVLQAKPGITGLWQVSGRSRVSFDEMVRLDLRYAATWSIWLDIKILLRTPAAVFFAEGAY